MTLPFSGELRPSGSTDVSSLAATLQGLSSSELSSYRSSLTLLLSRYVVVLGSSPYGGGDSRSRLQAPVETPWHLGPRPRWI